MRDETKKDAARSQADVQFDIEYNLIGCLLWMPDFYATVAGVLKAEYFQLPAHRLVFAEFERRVAAGLPADAMSILQSFPDEPIAANGGLRLHQHLRESVHIASRMTAAGQVNALRLNYTLAVSEGAAKHLTITGDSGIPPDVALQRFFNAVDEVRLDYTHAQRSADSMSIGDSMDLFVERTNRKIGGQVIDRRVKTGLAALDNMTGGFGEADLVIIAGRPGMGKTTLATSIARGAASPLFDPMTGKQTKPAYPVHFFSFEMGRDQINARMMAEDIAIQVHEAAGLGPQHLEYRHLINPNWCDFPDWERERREWGRSLWSYIDEARRRLKQLPIELDCSSSLTVGEIAARARKHRASLLIIDYIKFIKATDRYLGNRVLEVGEITGGLKRLAKELGIPIILLCQLNRAVENRKDKTPMLSDLRESGDIEQDADVVMFTYRKAYHDKTATLDNSFDVIIEKNRNGPTGTAQLLVDLGRSYIRDV